MVVDCSYRLVLPADSPYIPTVDSTDYDDELPYRGVAAGRRWGAPSVRDPKSVGTSATLRLGRLNIANRRSTPTEDSS